MEKNQNYKNFKKLLEYFVSHLEWCQNEDESFPGYTTYIKPIKNFVKTGAGYSKKRDYKIQQQIKDFCIINNHRICITVFKAKANKTYTSKSCYLHWEYSSINIIAIWNKSKFHIKKLAIYEVDWDNDYPSWDEPQLQYTLKQLGLFDAKTPNSNLKKFLEKFFNLFNSVSNENKDFEDKFNPTSNKSAKERILSGYEVGAKIIHLRHEDIKNKLVKFLKKEFGKKQIFQESFLGKCRVDVLSKNKKNEYFIYEIKSYDSATACIREAVGQLLEYYKIAKEKQLNIKKMYIVGPCDCDEVFLEIINHMCNNMFKYLKIDIHENTI